MEFVINGKNVSISERFHNYASEKIGKVEQLGNKVIRLEAKLYKEDKPRLASQAHRLELTVIGRGPVIRAEASAVDKYSAFDIAFGKLMERLRRASDKRKTHRTKNTPMYLADAIAFPAANTQNIATPELDITEDLAEDIPNSEPVAIDIRKKIFSKESITAEEAVDRMELVGHDFYLFVDTETDMPSAVYRRRGWNYGVISLGEV